MPPMPPMPPPPIGIAGLSSGSSLTAASVVIRSAATDTYENLVAAGVVDPTKVVRTALQDAASVAGLLITTEATIAQTMMTKNSPLNASGNK